MSRVGLSLSLLILAVGAASAVGAADYADGLAPPGVPASAFPAPGRPVAKIVTDTWHDEQSRDKAGEAERVMNLLGVTAGMTGGLRPRVTSLPRTSFPIISNVSLSGSEARVWQAR